MGFKQSFGECFCIPLYTVGATEGNLFTEVYSKPKSKSGASFLGLANGNYPYKGILYPVLFLAALFQRAVLAIAKKCTSDSGSAGNFWDQ